MTQKPGLLDYAALFALSLMWGSSFMFVEIALVQFGPFSLAASRILVAALVLWVAARATGHRLPTGQRIWLLFLGVGVVGLLIPFSAIAWAQQQLDSSLAAVMMAFTPLATVFIAHFATTDEKLGAWRLTGVLIGLGGVIALFGGVSLDGGNAGPMRLVAMLIATTGYALSSIMLKRVAHLPTLSTSAGVLIASAIVTTPLAFLFESPLSITLEPGPLGSILFLGIFSSALATLFMLWLIARVGVNVMALSSYLTPAIGVLWGILLLDERLTLTMILGFGLILAGVAVASLGQKHG